MTEALGYGTIFIAIGMGALAREIQKHPEIKPLHLRTILFFALCIAFTWMALIWSVAKILGK